MASRDSSLILHHLLILMLLYLYGQHVCPFVESLEDTRWLILLSSSLVVALLLRLSLRRSAAGEPTGVFWRELSCWALGSLLLSLVNWAVLDFPIGSGAKLCVGFLTLGSLSAGLQALQAERAWLRSRPPGISSPVPEPRHSLVERMVTFLGLLLTGSTSVTLLLVGKDLMILAQTPEPSQTLLLEIGAEIALVQGVMLVGTLGLGRSAQKNLRELLALQLESLAAATEGDLQQSVPVLREDELGAIAWHSNRLLRALRERERIRALFGKLVSPAIAEQLLQQDQKGGQPIEAVILFSDLRGFTALSETLPPQRVVELLNRYFTMMVAAVRAHGGVVDKFIGDAVMAVFGPAHPGSPEESALACAREMFEGLREVNQALEQDGLPALEHGIGLHQGRVIGGPLGSPDRMEFTFIGDPVNVAARVESMTRSLGRSLLLTESVFEQLGPQLQASLDDLGPQPLKGRAQTVRVYASTQDS